MNTPRLVSLGLTYLLALNLLGCGGGDELAIVASEQQGGGLHDPVLSEVYLSPTAAFLMQGDGRVEISARITYEDPGHDITELSIAMSDGTSLTDQVGHLADGVSGVFWYAFDIGTGQAGTISVEAWLIDSQGSTSNYVTVEFEVLEEAGAWIERKSGLDFTPNDVLWDGFQFLVVGDGGWTMTSADGIDWTLRHSGFDEDLQAIGWDLYDYVVVGEKGTVIMSSDGGLSWSSLHSGPDNVSLLAVAHHAWPIIVAGKNLETKAAVMLRSMDHGQTWEEIDEFPPGGRFVRDLVVGPGQYIATTGLDGQFGFAMIWRSEDGRAWTEVVVSPDLVSTLEIIYGDGEYWMSGSIGSLFRSLDGIHWTEMHSPAATASLQGIANLGPLVVAHGRNEAWQMGIIEDGVVTSDGGANWRTFSITDQFPYETRGMAFGAGRFVSVGQSLELPGQGAIFSTE